MTQPNATTGPRAYSAAHFALELDDKKDVGLFKSIEGGGVKTEMVKYQNGGEFGTFLRLGRPKYEDFKVQVGMAMSEPFYDWIKSFFKGEPVRKTGAVVAADFYYIERARRQFAEAMITEVGFPKLDGADKGACHMSVTISPETVVYMPGSNEKLQQSSGFNRQKLWAACNFSFVVDGFADACKRVTKVDAFAIKQKPIEYSHGHLRHVTKTPGRLEYPNLVFYVPEADAQPFIKHHADYTIGGMVQPNARLTGTIFTHDNENAPLFNVQFSGAEIFSITHDKADAGSEEIKQVKIELCVEGMEFSYVQQDNLDQLE